MKPCDQQQIDTLQHDLLAELKEHTFKTAALQESGVDCKFLHFRCIIMYVLNFSFLKRRYRAWHHISTVAESEEFVSSQKPAPP